MSQAREDVVVLRNVRLSFPKLFKPESATPDGPKKFSANFLMDPDSADGKANILAIKKAVKFAATKQWADKAEKVLSSLDPKRKCFRDGSTFTDGEGDVYTGFDGMMVAVASNAKRPQVLNRDKSPLAEEDGVIYGGCYVDAVISVYTITDKDRGGNGVFATLEVVRFRKDGEAFGAPPIDADDYLDDLDDEDDGMI